jgi:hypothetical protein
MAKNPKNYLAYLKHLVWILQQVCEISKNFGLYLKIIKNIFLAREYIIHF